MNRRSRRCGPAIVVALVVLATAVVVTVSCVQLLLDHAPLLPFATLADTAGTTTWDEGTVLVAAGVVAGLGIGLLLAALTPGAPTVLSLEPRDGQPDAGATRRSLNGALTAASRRVDGVDKAKVRVKRRTIAATVHTPLHDDGDLPDQVRTAITERLEDIAPTQRPPIRVRTNTAGSP